MMSFEIALSGSQIANKLSQDEEEFAYALMYWLDYLPDSFGTDAAHYMNSDDRIEVVKLLRKLADQIEGAK